MKRKRKMVPRAGFEPATCRYRSYNPRKGAIKATADRTTGLYYQGIITPLTGENRI